ncbi:MAG: hypothetical protein AAF968_00715 [Pseudomonadota bacterium]
MAEAGYEVNYPHFRRYEAETVCLACFEFWKYGGAFSIEFGKQVGPFTDWAGRVVPPHELEVSHLAPPKRAFLRRPGNPRVFDEKAMFPYEAIAEDRLALEALLSEVVSYLPQAEAWLRDGAVGANLFAFPDG